MKITFHSGAGGNVIPSRFLLQGKDPDDSILVDCGDAIPEKGEKKDTSFGLLAPQEVKQVLLTHGHTDHVGALCNFVEQGFNGGVISTPPTRQITEALLRDNYNESLVDDVFELYGRAKKYLDEFTVSPNVKATFYPATGHIMGASSILLELEKEKLRVLFSGDLGNTNKTMLEVHSEIPEADIVVIESTYGRKEHHLDFQTTLKNLYREINEVYDKHGNFYIPVLSINRLQEALYYVNKGMEEGLIPDDMNVVVDSALGEVITGIYQRKNNKQYYSNEAKAFFDNFSRFYPFQFKRKFDPRGRNIVLASSGLDGLRGRFRRYLKGMSDDKNSSVGVMSYTLEGSLLDDIKAKKENVRVNGGEIEFKAKGFNLDGFSSHADATQLLTWLEKTKAKYVFLVHGEDYSRNKLKAMIVERGLCNVENVFTPALGEEFDLTNLPKAKDVVSFLDSLPNGVKLHDPEDSISIEKEASTIPAGDNPDMVTLFGQQIDVSRLPKE